jgi:hypothetical protein
LPDKSKILASGAIVWLAAAKGKNNSKNKNKKNFFRTNILKTLST